MKRVAVIADTHGNSWALAAVLEDIRHREVDTVINLGDTADADMDPGGAIALLMDDSILSIAGNYETYNPGQLTTAQEAWLAGLPKTRDLGEIFCCHGTPRSDTQELVEEITPGRVELAEVTKITERLDGVKNNVVLCAHKHVPRTIFLATGQLVVNPGSVGLPAYWNDEPVLHVVEAGSPHARYAVLSRTTAGWIVEHLAIPYRWDLAAEAALKSGREDRAGFIRTGRAEIPPELLE